MTKGRGDDLKMLRALLRCDVLSEDEDKAFQDMWDRLDSGRIQSLTSKQREWVERVYYRLNLDKDEPSLNLASSGAVKITAAERQALNDWTKSLGPKPVRPPGRKA